MNQIQKEEIQIKKGIDKERITITQQVRNRYLEKIHTLEHYLRKLNDYLGIDYDLVSLIFTKDDIILEIDNTTYLIRLLERLYFYPYNGLSIDEIHRSDVQISMDKINRVMRGDGKFSEDEKVKIKLFTNKILGK